MTKKEDKIVLLWTVETVHVNVDVPLIVATNGMYQKPSLYCTRT